MRRRWRTIFLVIGTTLCVMIATVFVVSAFWVLGLDIDSMGVAAFGGTLVLGSDGSSEYARLYQAFYGPGLTAWNRWHLLLDYRGIGRKIEIPLYAVFLAVAVPTLLVWRFGRKPRKPGHCACGYNLTGNVSGRCPECGQAVA